MSDMMPSDETPVPEIRFLKLLVTVLTATMIAGLVAIVAILVIRLPGQAPMPALPDAITLPEGAAPAAITFASDYTIVLTDQGELRLYKPNGALHKAVPID